MGTRIACALALVVVLGCDDDASTSAPPTPPPQEPTKAPEKAPEPDTTGQEVPDLRPRTPLNELMRGHFMRGSQARDALIGGDVDEAKRHMAWLAENDLSSAVPDELRPRLEAMQAQARTFADATTLREAGQALASTLVRCAECHQEADGGPEFATPPLAEGDERRAHMRRHQWAARRMWEGLVTQDVERYNEGAQALQDAPLHAGDLPENAEEVQVLEQLTEHVHELARETASAQSEEDRARIYGHFLATCATCHRLLEITPGAPAPQNEPTNL